MCSDVCINKARGYSCDCPVGKTLSQNGRNCGGITTTVQCVYMCVQCMCMGHFLLCECV